MIAGRCSPLASGSLSLRLWVLVFVTASEWIAGRQALLVTLVVALSALPWFLRRLQRNRWGAVGASRGGGAAGGERLGQRPLRSAQPSLRSGGSQRAVTRRWLL